MPHELERQVFGGALPLIPVPPAYRLSWDEYFMILAQLVATRSTCISQGVGAILVRDRQVISTGYNGPPAGTPNCIDQGFCYGDIVGCLGASKPSRAIHAEVNAVTQAAAHGISTAGSTLYVTHHPCPNCLKTLIAARIGAVYYEADPPQNTVKTLQEMGLYHQIPLFQLNLSESAQKKAFLRPDTCEIAAFTPSSAEKGLKIAEFTDKFAKFTQKLRFFTPKKG